MISLEMLKVYERFGGDIDGFARVSTVHEKAVISIAQWSQIDRLLQEVHLIKHDLASVDFSRTVEEAIGAEVEAGEARDLIWQLG